MAGADGSIQADAARGKLEEIEQALRKEITRLMLKLDTERGGSELMSDREALANATKVRAQVLDAMKERGLKAIVDEAEARAIEAAQAVADDIDFGDFTPDISKDLERIVSGRMDEVTKAFKEGSMEINRAMRLGVTTAAPLDEAIAEVARVMETTIRQAQAAVDAAIMGCARDISVEGAKESQASSGETLVMVLTGPLDQKTRDFCRRHVGRAVLLDELSDLDNDTDGELPADIYAGGYNCRHTWAAMTLADAEAEGIAVVKA
jgi:hypothetical protein